MRLNKAYLGILTGMALALAACSGNNNDNKDAGTDAGGNTDAGQTGFQQPDNTVAINFQMDATNIPGFFADKELEWKGSFTYDEATRVLTFDVNWGGGNGPYVPLYDDGPWTSGGHEPKTATKGDGVFGATAFLPIPTADLELGYGSQIAGGTAKCSNPSGCWNWPEQNNGAATIPANSSTPIDLPKVTLPPAGNYDIKLTFDPANLNAAVTDPVAEPVQVKGNYCFWNPTNVTKNTTTGMYEFVLSTVPTCLKLNPDRQVQFVWQFTVTTDAGTSFYEYKYAEGTTAAYKGPTDADWVDAPVSLDTGGDHNPMFTIPPPAP